MKQVDKSIQILIIIILISFVSLLLGINITIPCIFNKITNLYCPGCGLTRMFMSIIKLDFYQAFRYNPLVFILLIFSSLLLIFNKIYQHITHKKIKIPKSVYIILIFVVITYSILRNIPWFSFLAPTLVK